MGVFIAIDYCIKSGFDKKQVTILLEKLGIKNSDMDQKLEKIINFMLNRETIIINDNKYIFLSRDDVFKSFYIFNRYSNLMPLNPRITLERITNNISAELLAMDKPIYIINKSVSNTIDSIKTNINKLVLEQLKFVNNKMVENGFTIIFTNLFTKQEKQELDIQYNNIINKNFKISWLELKDWHLKNIYILKIDDINFSLFTNKIMNKYNLLDIKNNFKDISVTTYN